jgi:DNA-binding transcriptional MerR regulator
MSGIDIDIERAIQMLKELEGSSPSYLEEFDEKKYKPSDLGISARAMNSWKEKGLLVGSNQKGWHKFNLSECIWLKIIQKLREFNISIDVIILIKEELFCSPDIQLEVEKSQAFEKLKIALEKENLSDIADAFDSSEMKEYMIKEKITLLDHLILDLIVTRGNSRLLFNLNGEIMVHKDNFEDQLRSYPEYMDFLRTAHISVSLNSLFYEVTNELIEDDDLRALNILSEQETVILNAIREKEIKKIEICFNDNEKPELIKVTRVNKLDSATRLKELLINKGYQDIKMTTQNGQVVHFENTIKTKV